MTGGTNKYAKGRIVAVHGYRLTVYKNWRHENRKSATFEELEVSKKLCSLAPGKTKGERKHHDIPDLEHWLE